MANSNFDPEAKYAALDERVANQGLRLTQIEQTMMSGFRQVEQTLGNLGAELRGGQKPQWQAISVAATVTIAFMGLVGTLAYMPVTSGLRDVREDVRANAKDSLSVDAFKEFKATYENNRLLNRTDVDAKVLRLDTDLSKLEGQVREAAAAVVPRGEHQERWRSQDAAVAAVQRQLDDLKAALGGIYGARDVILDLRERLDRVERRRLDPPP